MEEISVTPTVTKRVENEGLKVERGAIILAACFFKDIIPSLLVAKYDIVTDPTLSKIIGASTVLEGVGGLVVAQGVLEGQPIKTVAGLVAAGVSKVTSLLVESISEKRARNK